MKKKRAIVTCGEVSDDGTIIEPVRDVAEPEAPKLLCWSKDTSTIQARIEHNGRIYKPAVIGPSVMRAMTLPPRGSPCGSIRQLVDDISRLVVTYTSLSDQLPTAVGRFVLASWVIDALPTAPWLHIVGSNTMAGNQLFQVLTGLCRHAVPLIGVSAAGICSLPLEWRPTLLIRQPEQDPRVHRLLSAARNRNQFMPRNGRLHNLHVAVVTYSRSAGGDGEAFVGIEIPIGPSLRRVEILGEDALRRIVEEFQSRLVGYRRENYAAVRDSEFDAPQFASPIWELARALGACTPNDADLQAEAERLFEAQEAELHAAKWVDITVVITEAILGFIHEGKHWSYNGEIAKAAQAILIGRGETRREIEAREVGVKVRYLGLKTEPRDSRGIKLLLTDAVARRVHQLARDFDAPSIRQGLAGCPYCDTADAKSNG